MLRKLKPGGRSPVVDRNSLVITRNGRSTTSPLLHHSIYSLPSWNASVCTPIITFLLIIHTRNETLLIFCPRSERYMLSDWRLDLWYQADLSNGHGLSSQIGSPLAVQGISTRIGESTLLLLRWCKHTRSYTLPNVEGNVMSDKTSTCTARLTSAIFERLPTNPCPNTSTLNLSIFELSILAILQ